MTLSAEDLLGILNAEKQMHSKLRFREKDHPDYEEAVCPVLCPEFPEANIQFVTHYHISRIPRKYSFVLLVQQKRCLALDVGPGRAHYNIRTGQVVTHTHWQRLPDITNAEPDSRELTHWQWYKEFMEVAKIDYKDQYAAPKFDNVVEQSDLWNYDK
ncbi:hypothetical protein [Ponticaulis koreensis]|uniref:hypothetical protein n=1 Tax=Ponticaulis koreensis TaxID=1123045 RepID=UPI0003B70E59|nr:hypothetical protein [Ponticaulis koreensis]